MLTSIISYVPLYVKLFAFRGFAAVLMCLGGPQMPGAPLSCPACMPVAPAPGAGRTGRQEDRAIHGQTAGQHIHRAGWTSLAPFCYDSPLRLGWGLACRQGSHPGKSLVICVQFSNRRCPIRMLLHQKLDIAGARSWGIPGGAGAGGVASRTRAVSIPSTQETPWTGSISSRATCGAAGELFLM
jgi:hypothetical protein